MGVFATNFPIIGAGVKVLNSRHYGDQYVLINVAIPTYVTLLLVLLFFVAILN